MSRCRPEHDVLFEPLQLGPKLLKNRFYQTPHCTGFGSDLPATQAYHRGVKAEGGWAAVSIEWCSIHPEADEKPAGGAHIWDDHDVRNLSLTTEKIHEHDALAGIELGYNGPNVTNFESRLAARGPSQIPSDTFYYSSCYAIDEQELGELQGFYVTAALRARAAGFDIINVMGSHGACAPQQFLMPYYNKRADGYGGSFRNRARFSLELLEQVKEAVGDDCAVTTRFCIDSLHEDDQGIRAAEEGAAFIELADDLVDFWDLQVGGPTMAEWGEDAGPSRFFKENFQREWLRQVRPHTRKPIVGVGRFTNPDTMAAMIRSGELDIIGAARPSIADPHLPKKVEEGRVEDIRECIGCNICVSRHEQAATIVCTQNATTGEEYRRGWHPERFRPAANAENDVLVVGAGPAGMECALVLAKRGMRRVHLVDSAPEMGGSVNWISRLPGLAEWARVVTWRRLQLAKLPNATFIPNTALRSQDVLDYGAEIVVIATGSHWARDGLNGPSHAPIRGVDGHPGVFTPEDIMLDERPLPGDRVVVYDCDGYFVGASLAEKLARDGCQVRLATPLATVAPFMEFTLEATRMHGLLLELGVELVAAHAVDEFRGDVLSLRHVRARGAPSISWETDALVLVTQRNSDDALYRELKGQPAALKDQGIVGLHRIGDCLVPRLIAEAVFDGHRLGVEIDTDDPAKPLPYIRERRVLGATDADYDAMRFRGAIPPVGVA